MSVIDVASIMILQEDTQVPFFNKLIVLWQFAKLITKYCKLDMKHVRGKELQ